MMFCPDLHNWSCPVPIFGNVIFPGKTCYFWVKPRYVIFVLFLCKPEHNYPTILLDCTGHPQIQNRQLVRFSVAKATQNKARLNVSGSEI